MTALTEAELNLFTVVRAVRETERNVQLRQDEYDEAEAKLRHVEEIYANAVVALIEARKALR